MAKSTWTIHQLNLLRKVDLSHGAVAEIIHKSEAAVRGKRQRLGIVSDVDDRLSRPPASTTVAQDQERAKNEHWKAQYDALNRKYATLLKNNTATAQLVEIASSLAPTAYNPAPKITMVTRGKGSPQSAVLLLSDTHIGQVISPEQTLGCGHYDFKTFLARLKFLEESVISILRDHTTTKVDELIVCLGGDLLHGALGHGAEVAQHNTLFTQFYAGGHAIAQFMRNLAPNVPKIRVQCVVGNHPRWSNQKKMPTDNRFSNLDHFLSAYIRALTSGLENVIWDLNQQPFSLFKVYDFLFHLSHGDHLKGGDKALGIPNHSVARMVSATSQMFGKEVKPSPHYYLTGHLHREISLPHARGSVIVNGGFPGLDSYGLAGGFSPVDPSQSFFFVHEKYGKTAHYNIQLKWAKDFKTSPYEIPGDFPCE